VARTSQSKGFLAREHHRVLLTVHALVMIFGLVACAFLNRVFTPDRFWVQWVALAWGALFLAHLAIFFRGTLATMGGKR
jgi:ABC-type Fe3+-siderophore transport system permease subunit